MTRANFRQALKPQIYVEGLRNTRNLDEASGTKQLITEAIAVGKKI
jgi:hypothetical protein